VPWHRKPGFKLVAVKDVRRLTGLELPELLSRQNTQRLTRIEESGSRRVRPRSRRTSDRRAAGLKPSLTRPSDVAIWRKGDTRRLQVGTRIS